MGRRALIVLCALLLDVTLVERASATQVCAWIVESVEHDGTHTFDLNLGADAPTSVSARFRGPNFTSASMGGDMIQLEPNAPQDVDGEGFDVSPGDEPKFDVALFDRPLATLDEVDHPKGGLLAAFVFEQTVDANEHMRPAALSLKQCKHLG